MSAADYEDAVERGPPFVEAQAEYPILLERAGWKIRQSVDLTEDYADSVARLIGEFESREEALEEMLGEDNYAEYLARRRRALGAIEDGLLQRGLFVTTSA